MGLPTNPIPPRRHRESSLPEIAQGSLQEPDLYVVQKAPKSDDSLLPVPDICHAPDPDTRPEFYAGQPKPWRPDDFVNGGRSGAGRAAYCVASSGVAVWPNASELVPETLGGLVQEFSKAAAELSHYSVQLQSTVWTPETCPPHSGRRQIC
ncbi:hypothetical protein ACFX1S_009370 [Malus domestica]